MHSASNVEAAFAVSARTSLKFDLGGFGLIRHLLRRYRIRRSLLKSAPRRPVGVAIRSVS